MRCLERGGPVIDLSHTERASPSLSVCSWRPRVRGGKEWKGEVAEARGSGATKGSITSLMCIEKHEELWTIDFCIWIYCVVVSITKIGGIFYSVLIFIDVQNTYCIWCIHSSFHKYLLDGLHRQMILFSSLCSRLPMGEESRIIIIVSLQGIGLHFRGVR